MAVTKTHPAEVVALAAQAGLRCVGENRVQEGAAKRAALEAAGGGAGWAARPRWELIGHLQSNKARLAVRNFDRVQSVDSVKLVGVLERVVADEGRTAYPILLEVNAGDDPAKFGVDCDGAAGLLEAALAAPHLRVEGLMTVAPLADDPDVARRCFTRLRELRDRLTERYGVALRELSMGMSGDMEIAIECGSTMVRVGSALFGARE